MEHEDFYYPDNLLRKVNFFGWSPLALIFVAVSVLISVIFLLFFGMYIPLVLSIIGGILTLGVDEVSIYGHLKRYGKYLLTDQVEFYWDADFEERRKNHVTNKKQKRSPRADKH